jgi:NAD(P)-dependent dehydrogenase (short-subunit alcohol dehydrogenase family)
VIIIAGGLGLIGKYFVKAVLAESGIVIIADIQKEIPQNFNKELSTLKSNRFEYQVLDITSKTSINSLLNQIKERYAHIDGFVNTAYPRNKNWGRKFEDVTYEDFCENVNLHLGGYFLASQQMAIFFKKQGFGNIINIASIQGVSSPKFDTYEGVLNNGKEMTSPVEYTAIKSSLIHLTQYMAKYFKDSSIRFNCISPGGILDKQPEEFLKRYKKYCTSKGMLNPEDLSGTLIYLLSDLSKFVNGQNIIVDDGWTL